MINRLYIPLIFLFSAFIDILVATDSGEKIYYGSITLPLGQVSIQTLESNNWNKAGINESVYVHEKVKTVKKSRCEIVLANKQIVRIGEQAVVELQRTSEGEDSVFIELGKVWVNRPPGSNGKHFKIQSPVSVCAIRGTVYRLDCDSNHSSYRVYDGEITVSLLDENGKIIPETNFVVGAGEELILAIDFEEYKRQQKEEFQKFLDEQQLGFENYIRRQEDFFREFKRMEEEAFKQFKSFHIAQEKFDREKDKESDWVKWNLERDNDIEK